MNILLTCCKNSFAANMTIFRELSLCCWSVGNPCPRSVSSVTSTSSTTEVLVLNPEWIFNYECLPVHEICQINFTDACCTHKWLCNGPLEAKNCVKMSRPLRWNDTYGIFFMYRLCAAPTIWMDGTFKVAPSLFTQICRTAWPVFSSLDGSVAWQAGSYIQPPFSSSL